MSIQRIPSHNRQSALGFVRQIRPLIGLRLAYVAAVARYGRPMLRAYYWDKLPTVGRRLAACA